MNCQICGHIPTGLTDDPHLFKLAYMRGMEPESAEVCRACLVLAMNAMCRQLDRIKNYQRED